MPEVKWIKVSTSMFESSRKIKQIEIMPEGDTILVIWLKLLLLAGNINDGGAIYLTPEIPYTEEMLAHELRRPLNTVRMALSVFERFGMIEIIDDILHLSSWERYQNIDGLDKIREQNRFRQQKRRDKVRKALIGDGGVCEYCGNEGTTVDHIIPTSKGGLDIPENTVCSCLSCNMKKSNRDLVAFLNEMLLTSVDFELDRIESNKKFMAYVRFDDSISRFVSRDTSRDVTQCHAIEEEREKDKEYSFIHSDEQIHSMMGKLGQGVVKLSDEQIDSLLELLSLEEFNHYVSVIAECELNGKSFKRKTHYQAILDMVKKDRATVRKG